MLKTFSVLDKPRESFLFTRCVVERVNFRDAIAAASKVLIVQLPEAFSAHNRCED